MDLKREVKVGDYVMYEDGHVVCDEDGIPLKVIEIRPYSLKRRPCVFYSNGEFDYLAKVEVAPPLLLELL